MTAAEKSGTIKKSGPYGPLSEITEALRELF